MPHDARYPQLSDRLDARFFPAALFVAFLLHLISMVIWQMMPKTQVVDIPVKALNIKLGDADTLTPEELNAVQQQANTSEVENVISRMVREAAPAAKAKSRTAKQDKSAAAPQAVSRLLDKALNPAASPASTVAPVPRQFVRETEGVLKLPGNVNGNSNAKNAELISRYEQLISGWIQKFKQYPEEARAKGITGETMVRIRIDRKGNVRYYALEYTTGSPILDRAAIDMIRRANPVPAVPDDYPKDELTEFLIPVSFKLQ